MVIRDILGNWLESLYLVLLIRGNDYNSLSKYLEVSKYRFEVLKEAKFDVASKDLHDRYMEELDNQGQLLSNLYLKL